MESATYTQIILQIGRYFIGREIDIKEGFCHCWRIGKRGNYKNKFETTEILTFWERKITR